MYEGGKAVMVKMALFYNISKISCSFVGKVGKASHCLLSFSLLLLSACELSNSPGSVLRWKRKECIAIRGRWIHCLLKHTTHLVWGLFCNLLTSAKFCKRNRVFRESFAKSGNVIHFKVNLVSCAEVIFF